MVQRHSARQDVFNFQHVFKERQPQVQQASRALQDVIGIEPGTRMIGHLPVTLWELPVPPRDSVNKLIERVMSKFSNANPVEAAVQNNNEEDSGDEMSDLSDESERPEDLLWYPQQGGEMTGDTNDESTDDESTDELKRREDALFEHVDFGSEHEPGYEMPVEKSEGNQHPTGLKRRRHDSSSKPQQRAPAAKKPKIVIDLTQSPFDSPARPPLKPLLQPRAAEPPAGTNALLKPASPPDHWQTPPYIHAKFKKAPAYWYPELSLHIVKWLEQLGTKSSQVNLSSVKLSSNASGDRRHNANSHVSINAKDYAKVKLMRIRLPASAANGAGQLDWAVIHVECKKGSIPFVGYDFSDDEDKPSANTPVHLTKGPPYWLFAFPLAAVTNSQVQLLEPQTPPLRPQRRQRKQKTPREQSNVRSTTLMLGGEGKVPLLHGRGVNRRFADDFIYACAKGKAMVVLKSSEAVPLEAVQSQ